MVRQGLQLGSMAFRVLLMSTLVMGGCRTTGSEQTSLQGFAASPDDVEPRVPEDMFAMFHHTDPSLEEIARLIRDPRYQRLDIAMYSFTTSDSSPVIQALRDPVVQQRIQSGDFIVRIIFQGYDGSRESDSTVLEEIGADVRTFRSKHMHHKLGIFDANDVDPVVVTGSANWSMSSYSRYNENILFVKNHLGVARAYQAEFEKLWSWAVPFGSDLQFPANTVEDPADVAYGVEPLFNSENFEFSDGTIRIKRGEGKRYTLTRALVKAIDGATNNIKMATTRIALRPVYDALLRAVERGVTVQIITNQDQYDFRNVRDDWRLKTCEPTSSDDHLLACCDRVRNPETGVQELMYDPYEDKCSTSQVHSYFLAQDTFPGHENVDVRIKFFSLAPGRAANLLRQMHAKYTIVDDRIVFAGSFNYSVSSEKNHLENVVMIDGARYPETLADFQDNFGKLFNLGREEFLAPEIGFRDRFEKAHAERTQTTCDFTTGYALTYEEIDQILGARTRHRQWRRLPEACAG